jgi:hypothetical protein
MRSPETDGSRAPCGLRTRDFRLERPASWSTRRTGPEVSKLTRERTCPGPGPPASRPVRPAARYSLRSPRPPVVRSASPSVRRPLTLRSSSATTLSTADAGISAGASAETSAGASTSTSAASSGSSCGGAGEAGGAEAAAGSGSVGAADAAVSVDRPRPMTRRQPTAPTTRPATNATARLHVGTTIANDARSRPLTATQAIDTSSLRLASHQSVIPSGISTTRWGRSACTAPSSCVTSSTAPR